MDYKDEVEKVLGKNNVTILLDETRDGNIDDHAIKAMALQMNKRVHGVFKNKKGQLEPVDLIRLLLDRWWKEELYKEEVDGFSKLTRILKSPDVRLGCLAVKMCDPQEIHTDQVGKHFENAQEKAKPNNLANGNMGEPASDNEEDDVTKPLQKNKTMPHPQTIRDSAKLSLEPVDINDKEVVSDFRIDSDMEANKATEPLQQNLLRPSNIFLVFLGLVITVLLIICLVSIWVRPVLPSINEKNHTMSTRSIKVNKGKLEEFHKCPVNQSNIPDLPVKLLESVGIYTRELGVLVCGGTDETDHDPRLCYTHKLGSDRWEQFEYRLNTNRIGSYIKISENKIFILGGQSSEPFHDGCYPSQEVLDLEKLSDGWKVEESEGVCFKEQIIEIPCMSS